jgi:O-antigen/teichoic acid export membrane protein
MGLGLLIGVWVARYLGPEKFGVLNFAVAFVGLFGAIATLGTQSIVTRDLVRYPQDTRRILGAAAILHIVGGIVSFILILGVHSYLRPDDSVSRAIVAILGLTMLLKVGDIAVYWFESQLQSKYTVWVQNTVFLAIAATKALLILKNAPLIAFAYAMLVEAALISLMLLAVMGLRAPELRGLSISMARSKSMLSDSWPLLLSSATVVVNMNIGKTFVMYYSGDKEVGIYSAAYALVAVWYFIPVLLGASIAPILIKTLPTNIRAYVDNTRIAYKVLVVSSTVYAVSLWVFSDSLILLLYGNDYIEAGEVLGVLAWSAIFVSVISLRTRLLVIEDLGRRVAVIGILGLFLNLALLLYLVPRFGALGAAYAFTTSWILNAALYPIIFRRFDKHRLSEGVDG